MTSWGGPARAEGTPDTHPCPGPLCQGAKGPADVPWHMLMCGRDWSALRRGAPAVARAVWRTWADGRGSGTAAHAAAMRTAITTARRLAEAAAERRHV